MSKPETAAYLLTADHEPSWLVLQDLLPHLEGYQYRFTDTEAYDRLLKEDMAGAMEVYWREILYRAHWAGAASLIRTHRWMSGLLDAVETENLVVFSACLRGLIESCADTWHSLCAVAPTLASANTQITKALRKQLNEQIENEDIESRLIHFTFARGAKRGESLPANHKAELVSTYLKNLEAEQPSIRAFYAVLCDTVHPGSGSVVSYAKHSLDDDKTANIVLTFELEPRRLAELAVGFRIILADLMATGFNTGLLTLRTLNALPLSEVHTPFVESLPFVQNPAWDLIQGLLSQSAQQ